MHHSSDNCANFNVSSICRLELNQKQLIEDNSTIADLKSNISLLQEAMEKHKKEMESLESDKVDL